MTPTHRISRRSFLGRVGAVAATGGALLAVGGSAGAAPARTGDGDFASPVPLGDTFQSDPPPGRATGRTDSDSGRGFDLAGHGAGTGRTRQAVHAERCAGLRQRLARLRAIRPPTPDLARQLNALEPYVRTWRCGPG